MSIHDDKSKFEPIGHLLSSEITSIFSHRGMHYTWIKDLPKLNDWEFGILGWSRIYTWSLGLPVINNRSVIFGP